jgi:uncharacterized protein
MDAYQFDPVDVRILAVLVEKQALTPDSYPLTLNALIAACNQLTSRDPVMQLDESAVLSALDRLFAEKLVAERTPAGSRVAKYEHRLGYVWNIDGARLAALAMLMLRGTQTAAEIRSRSGRLYAFSGTEEVETALEALAEKYPPMTRKLPRQPGAREARWAHLLSGEVGLPDTGAEEINLGLTGRVAALEAQVDALKTRLAEIEARLDN